MAVPKHSSGISLSSEAKCLGESNQEEHAICCRVSSEVLHACNNGANYVEVLTISGNLVVGSFQVTGRQMTQGKLQELAQEASYRKQQRERKPWPIPGQSQTALQF